MGQGQPRIKLNFGHTKNVLTRSIFGVVRPDCGGHHPATSSRRRRPTRRPPPPSGTPFPPIPARYRQKMPPHRGPAGIACASTRLAPHRPARGPNDHPAHRRTRATAAHARPARLLPPPHYFLANSASNLHQIFHNLSRIQGDLHSRARARVRRASHSVNKRRVGFAEVVGISFYVPWLSRTTIMKTSSIETI